MALFMDRHDVEGATAADVAQAHMADVKVSARHGVQFLAYWFDADTRAVFCFAHAPTADALQATHEESHGLVPNEIIPVSEDSVFRFLGRIHDPAGADEITTAFRAILFTDLVGSTSLVREIGDAAYVALLSEHDLIIRRALAARRGREVKHTGDGILASFDAVADALGCASDIQDGFEARSAGQGTPEMRVRIGIAAGEPVRHNDDIFGSTVNLAARLCDAAGGGQVLVSEPVRTHPGAAAFAFRDAAGLALKGFEGDTRAFELVRLSAAASQ